MELAAIAKTHFELLRMRVDIHELRIEGEIENIGGMAAAVENVAIGEAAPAFINNRSRTILRLLTNQNCWSGLRARRLADLSNRRC